jgi:tetratricopeptide (TPR) repeat protein
LDELSFEKPRLAARLAKKSLPRVKALLLPELLAVYGTANRRSYELGKARVAFEAGIEMAQRMENIQLEAQLKQRFAYVPGEHGNFKVALKMTIDAGSLFEICDFRIGVGRCLVDQGLWRFHLGQYHISISANQRALAILPASERRNRDSAIIGQAYSFQKLGDLQAGSAQVTEAIEKEDLGAPTRGSLFAILGSIAEEQGDLNRALESFGRSCDCFTGCELFLAAALAGSHEVRVRLVLGHNHLACVAAKGLGKLIEGIGSKPAVALLMDLIRQALTGEIRIAEEVCQGLQAEVARARHPRRVRISR